MKTIYWTEGLSRWFGCTSAALEFVIDQCRFPGYDRDWFTLFKGDAVPIDDDPNNLGLGRFDNLEDAQRAAQELISISGSQDPFHFTA